MALVDLLRKWLVTTPIGRGRAPLLAAAFVILPTIYRLSLDHMVMGIGYCPYLPFVLFSALLLGWRWALVVTLASAIVVDALFVGPRFQVVEGATDMLGDLGFLAASAIIITLVQAIRTAFEDLVGPTSTDGVFFSLEGGQVWASWPTAGFHLRLGSQEVVEGMMNDFLAQSEVGRRLAGTANLAVEGGVPSASVITG